MTSKNIPVKDLPAEIADFYDAIVEKVIALRLNTQQTMVHIKKEQQEMASQLQEHLAQGESLRKADFQTLMGEVVEQRKAREKEVMAMLEQFQHEEQVIAEGLKKLFSEGRQVRLRDFKRFIAETERATVARKAEIAEISQMSMAIRKSAEETIAQFRAEREEMVKSWKALAVKMQKKRSRSTKVLPKVPASPALEPTAAKVQKKSSRTTRSEPKTPEMSAALPTGEE
jgi:hypothetical protein